MEKSKLLTFAVIGLLLLNIGTIGFLFLNSPKNQRPPMGQVGPQMMIIEKLHFDKEQQIAFGKLIDWHENEISKYDNQISTTKKELYELLSENEINISKKDSLISVIGNIQEHIEETNFKHFEDIKKLCHPDQMQYFDDFAKELGRIFAPMKPKDRPLKRHD